MSNMTSSDKEQVKLYMEIHPDVNEGQAFYNVVMNRIAGVVIDELEFRATGKVKNKEKEYIKLCGGPTGGNGMNMIAGITKRK